MDTSPAISVKLIVLRTADLERARLFYECLGFEFAAEQHGSGPRHYAAETDAGILELYPETQKQPATPSTRLGFGVNDPDAVFDAVGPVGGETVRPGKQTPWGYVAVVRDPDGRTVELYRNTP